MSTPVMRPTFVLHVRTTPAQTAERIEELLHHDTYAVVGRRAGHHMMLTVSEAQRHFWSPWLNLEVEQEPGKPGGLTTVHGRFSPAPSVWTGFMLAYITLGTIGFFAAMFGASQWMMGSTPHLFWGVLACAILAAATWWFSLVGQKLAHEQMHLLRETVERELGAVPDADIAATTRDAVPTADDAPD